MTDDTHDNDTPAEGVREPEQQGSDEVAASGKENYAEHLARATPDADQNKALLQARYKALHDADQADKNS